MSPSLLPPTTAPTTDLTLPAHPIPESSLTPAASAPIPSLFSLANRTTIITGGARGLGLSLASAVLEAGGDVVVLDILDAPAAEDWEGVERLAAGSAGKGDVSGGKPAQHASYHRTDITSEASVDAVIEVVAAEAVARGRPVRGLVSCAGIQQMRDAMEYPVDGYRRMFEVNVVGNFVVARAVARVLRDGGAGGSVVFIASMSGVVANRGLHCSAYNSSKAAVQQMTRSLSMEWGRYGIRVNSLSPGYIRTKMTDQLLEEKPEVEAIWMQGAALGRLGAPEDFKAPAVYLLADGSAWQTGSDLRVDGGHCASA